MRRHPDCLDELPSATPCRPQHPLLNRASALSGVFGSRTKDDADMIQAEGSQPIANRCVQQMPLRQRARRSCPCLKCPQQCFRPRQPPHIRWQGNWALRPPAHTSENGARCQGPGACKRGGAIAQARRINSARAHFAHLAHDVADHSIFDAHHASGPLRRLPSLQLELGVVELASDRWPVGAVSDLT